MMVKKRIKIEEQLFLQRLCIDIIEKKLDLFFDLRFKYMELIADLYKNGKIKSYEDILSYINISGEEIKKLIESIEYTLSREIIQIEFPRKPVGKENDCVSDMWRGLDDSLNEMIKTEQITGIYESIIHKSLSIIIETYSIGKILNYFLNPIGTGEFILCGHSLRKQRLRHGELLNQQLQGNLLNLKTDLRNKLVKCAVSFIAVSEHYNEDSIVA